MKRLLALIALMGVCLLPAAFADATFRQVMEIKSPLMAMMPSAAAGPAAQFFGKPTEVVSKVKGTRAYSGFGSMVSIMDSTKGEIILLDTTGKRYAVTTMSDYLANVSQSVTGGMPEMPEAARQILENMQFKVESRDTGRSERIQGIDTDESETTLSISIPLPMPIPGSASNTMEITGMFHLWKPKAGEMERVPALREINAYYLQSGKMGGGDVTSMMKKMFGAFPGLSDKISDLTAALQKGSAITLRMRGAVTIPALAAMLKQAHAAGAGAPDIPDGPLVEINSDLKDLSTDAIPDSAFRIPEGYAKAPLEDLIKGLIPGAK